MDLDAIRAHLPEHPRALTHIIQRFTGQTVDEVHPGADAALFEPFISAAKLVKGFAAVHRAQRAVMDGLQAQFNRQVGPRGVFCQQVGDILRDAVRTGRDGKTSRPRQGERPVIPGAQHGCGGVGPGERLEVGDIPGVRPFPAQLFNTCRILLLQRRQSGDLIAAAAPGTKGASAYAQCPVPVGAGESAVQRHARRADAVPAFQKVGIGVISLVIAAVGKRRHSGSSGTSVQWKHQSFASSWLAWLAETGSSASGVTS